MFENLGYLESLYTRFRGDPQSVSAEWRDYFSGNSFENGRGNGQAPSSRRWKLNPPRALQISTKNFKVSSAIIAGAGT